MRFFSNPLIAFEMKWKKWKWGCQKKTKDWPFGYAEDFI